MLDSTLVYGLKCEEFKALHYVAWKWNLQPIGKLLERESVNAILRPRSAIFPHFA